MNQLNFFDGRTFVQSRDGERLGAQMAAVLQTMGNGEWWTLTALSAVTGAPEASVSARLRDLRKARFGGHGIEREHVHNGLHRYRLVKP